MTTTKNFTWGEKLPTLRGTGLVLRALEKTDIPALYEIFGDTQTMRYWSSAPLESVRAAGELLESIQAAFAERRLFQWGIATDSVETIIGTCTLVSIDAEHRRCEIGFALTRRRWGRGEASRAVAAMIEFAFGALDLHRIEADVDPRNARSLRLLERLGFQHEGLLRERYHVNGETQDSAMLGLLRPDWRRAALSGAPSR